MKRYHLELTVGLFCLLPGLVRAHHSIAVEYDMHTQGAIEGIVSEVWFKNPHVRYYLSVTDDQVAKLPQAAHETQGMEARRASRIHAGELRPGLILSPAL